MTILAVLALVACGRSQPKESQASDYVNALKQAAATAPTANQRFDWTVELFQALVDDGRSEEARAVFLEACAVYSQRPRLEDLNQLLEFSIRRADLSLTQYLLHLAEQELPDWQQHSIPLERARAAAIALASGPARP